MSQLNAVFSFRKVFIFEVVLCCTACTFFSIFANWCALLGKWCHNCSRLEGFEMSTSMTKNLRRQKSPSPMIRWFFSYNQSASKWITQLFIPNENRSKFWKKKELSQLNAVFSCRKVLIFEALVQPALFFSICANWCALVGKLCHSAPFNKME